MLEMKKSEFLLKRDSFRNLKLLHSHRNGNETYSYTCNCPKCNGTGYLTWTNVDNGVCYKCEGTGKVTEKLKIITEENYNLRQAERSKKAEQFKLSLEQAKQQCIQRSLEAGYKLVDFKVAGWFFGRPGESIEFNSGKYYIIERETEKAVLVSYKDKLEACVTYELWIPKKAIIK